MKSLHKKIDSMPDEAPWNIRDIVFSDRPNEKFLVQYRDILDAIKALMGDPAFEDKLVYKPSRVFTNKSKKSRIYSEMWTGMWWSAVQVRLYCITQS